MGGLFQAGLFTLLFSPWPPSVFFFWFFFGMVSRPYAPPCALGTLCVYAFHAGHLPFAQFHEHLTSGYCAQKSFTTTIGHLSVQSLHGLTEVCTWYTRIQDMFGIRSKHLVSTCILRVPGRFAQYCMFHILGTTETCMHTPLQQLLILHTDVCNKQGWHLAAGTTRSARSLFAF